MRDGAGRVGRFVKCFISVIFNVDDFCPTPGKYTVMKQDQAGGPSLIISLVEDGCTARVKILTTSPEVWFGSLQ